MMKSGKVFLAVLYLLLYSSFSTANLDPDVVDQVEKGISTTVELSEILNELVEWASKAEKGGKIIQKAIGIFGKLGKIAANLGPLGAVVGLIFAFIPKEDPLLEFMKVQFSEVNRKLDSMALQINTLGKEIEWAAYASAYSRDENNIKNAWIKLREFIDHAAEAKTKEEKMRVAERFVTFYETTGTESSVFNFHRYLTENNPTSLNQNLLVLVTQKSKGDFKTLVQFTSYFTSLMVTGLQLNLYYYALKGYDGKLKAKEAVTQLSNIQEKIQDVLIECTDNFEVWAEKDVQQIGTNPLPDNINLAYRIKKHLDKKFNWFEWTVIVHEKKDGEERTNGNSIKVIAQDKVVIHLLHREKGFTVKGGIKTAMKQEWNRNGKLCANKISKWPIIFSSVAMKHVEYIHEPSDYDQTVDNELVKLECPMTMMILSGHVQYTGYTTFTIYLRSQKLVENRPCSDVNCNNGKCRQIKDTSGGICKCEKMFYGPTCEGSVQNDIDFAAVESELIGITFQPVPDLTAIYFDLREMKEYIGAQLDNLRVFRCGVNAQCSTTNHVRSCSCVSPWVLWEGHDAHSQGCRYQNLRWVPRSQNDGIPQHTVKSRTEHHICRARGPDGGWHGGWIWIHSVNTCNYEYDWKERRATSFQVLVDPCGSSGVQWLSGGIYHNTVEIGQAISWPWITYLVCSQKSNPGIPGKLFRTRHGLMCHYGYRDSGKRDSNFYSLVKKQCI
ncbi:uncharacterized protein LOC133134014 [Conger conger]|uniref:uncharacterized protein LOC133134014 n=1 Tax=Conger conger TaxID=82655 RepID=UPI002A5A36BA|nr:uncharacterized protein LOC133134014 [Conger conger]